jgi:hypothetical protein
LDAASGRDLAGDLVVKSLLFNTNLARPEVDEKHSDDFYMCNKHYILFAFR